MVHSEKRMMLFVPHDLDLREYAWCQSLQHMVKKKEICFVTDVMTLACNAKRKIREGCLVMDLGLV